MFLSVPYLRPFVAGFSPQRPWFNPRVVYMEFVVHKFALRHVFIWTLRFSPTNYHSTNAACTPSSGKLHPIAAAVWIESVPEIPYFYWIRQLKCCSQYVLTQFRSLTCFKYVVAYNRKDAWWARMEGNLSQVAVVNDKMIWASRGPVLQLAGRRNYKKRPWCWGWYKKVGLKYMASCKPARHQARGLWQITNCFYPNVMNVCGSRRGRGVQ